MAPSLISNSIPWYRPFSPAFFFSTASLVFADGRESHPLVSLNLPSSMAASKILILSVVLALAIVVVGSEDGETVIHVVSDESEDSESLLKLESEQLKMKISSLESANLEKARELKINDETISLLEREIRDKAASVASLQGEVELLQKKGVIEAQKFSEKSRALSFELEKEVEKLKKEAEEQSRQRNALEARTVEAERKVQELNLKLGSKKEAVNVEELVGNAQARSKELEKKVYELKNEIEDQTKQKKAFEARAMEAEKKLQELKLKLENLEKTNNEQKRKIRKIEHTIKEAEEELLRLQMEATSKSKELREVHGAWLPPWFAHQISRSLEGAAAYWSERGEPILDILMQKVSERSAQAQKWAKPHLEAAKTKWVPIVKANWVAFTANVRPHAEKASAKAAELIEACRSAAASHIIKFQELSQPYVQEAKKALKPYIEQVATAAKPHVHKVRDFLKPYTRRARTYHLQIQRGVRQNLNKYELTKHLATKELVWFVASALLLAFPIFVAARILSSLFRKKTKKRLRSGRPHNSHNRRHKRRHGDQ